MSSNPQYCIFIIAKLFDVSVNNKKYKENHEMMIIFDSMTPQPPLYEQISSPTFLCLLAPPLPSPLPPLPLPWSGILTDLLDLVSSHWDHYCELSKYGRNVFGFCFGPKLACNCAITGRRGKKWEVDQWGAGVEPRRECTNGRAGFWPRRVLCCRTTLWGSTTISRHIETIINKPAAQAADADHSRWSSTNRLNQPLQ